MSELSRKQRELLQREQLILDTAQEIWHNHGYQYLTMERLADAVEYSKGTIYNHFSSKEDLVCTICCRCIQNLIDIFRRAANFDGSTRERFLAIGIGYSLYHQLNRRDAINIQTVKSHSVREKISREKLHEMESLEQEIAGITHSIVQEALQCGDLPASAARYADSIVFGSWAMHYGGILLDKSDIPLDQLGFSPVVKMLWNSAIRFLDGFHWQPLSLQSPDEDNTAENDALLEKLSSALFADELNELKNKGTSD